MTPADIAPTSGKVYKKLPLTRKERQILLNRYKQAPFFRKKAETEGKQQRAKAEMMLDSLFVMKNTSKSK